MTRAADRSQRRVLYGRKRGRPLSPGREAALRDRLPGLTVALPEPPARLEPRALFKPPPTHVWLEIGFGKGEHLAAQAEARPEIGFIGCEPYLNGVASLLARVDERRLDNVRIFTDDARALIGALDDRSIGRAFALFPDPWPKTRHHKRRLLSTATLDALARVLEPEAELSVATDHAGYARWILARVLRHPRFEWTARGRDDWRQRPADWPETRYERKAAAAGRRCLYLRFRLRAGD